MAAVIAAGGCSGGPPPPPPPPCLLFPLTQEHQAAPAEESVAGSFTAFPGEHLVSPRPRASAASRAFFSPVAALHSSDTMACSYCTRCRVTSQPLGPVLCVSHVLALSMYKTILQGDSISLTLSAAENKFSIPLGVTMLKFACLCPFLCLHQTVGVSKGFTQLSQFFLKTTLTVCCLSC